MADQNPNTEQGATNQPNNQQQNAIDYGKIEEILNKREASIHSGIIKNYLKEQGICNSSNSCSSLIQWTFLKRGKDNI